MTPQHGRNMRQQKSAIVEFDKEKQLEDLGLVVMVEKSRDGEKTRLHYRKVSRVQTRRLTKDRRKE